MTKKELAKVWIEGSQDSFLRGLRYLPDDALSWSPAATSKSALAITAHVVATNYFFAQTLTDPAGTPPEFSFIDAKTEEVSGQMTDREGAVTHFNQSCEALLAAIAGTSEAQAEGAVNTPFGPKAFASWSLVPATHMDYHSGQLAYIQSILGDDKFHWDDSDPVTAVLTD